LYALAGNLNRAWQHPFSRSAPIQPMRALESVTQPEIARMLNYTPKQHVSAALAHLRHGVTGAAVVVLVCAIVQMLVFGFVHFTNVRWGPEPSQAQAQPVVISQNSGGTATWRDVAVPTTKTQHNPAAISFPRPITAWDAGLHVASDMAVMGGVAGCMVLLLMTFMGVAVAGGASVPGVERAVSAATWAMLLGAACVPWRDFFASVPFPGVFGDYQAMIALSAAVDGGSGSELLLFTSYLFMPIAALIAAMLVLHRFRSGVEYGIIVTSVSELDERLEREMEGIRSRGVTAAGASRAVGALNHAIGEQPSLALTSEEPPLAATGTTGKPAGGGRNWLSKRGIGQADPGDPLQRPI
jgi:hypothetical protein